MEVPAEWSEPVTVEIGGVGNWVTITSSLEAADCLIDDWPLDEGEALRDALEVCFQVVQGSATPEEAREAFLEAGREAAIYVRPD
jgi:hypothetical protein